MWGSLLWGHRRGHGGPRHHTSIRHAFILSVWNTSHSSTLIYSPGKKREGGENITTTTQRLESREGGWVWGGRETWRHTVKRERGFNSLWVCWAPWRSYPLWKKSLSSSTSVSIRQETQLSTITVYVLVCVCACLCVYVCVYLSVQTSKSGL